MFNNEVILTIAQAILANTKVIQSLVDHLPAEVREKVASVVVPAAPVAFTQAAPTVAAPASTIVQVVAAPSVPVVSGTPVVMPAPPTFAAPVVPLGIGTAPFSDPKGLIDFVMNSYKALGTVKGAGIQGVLVSLGYQNINDVNPAHYGALFIGIEALKA